MALTGQFSAGIGQPVALRRAAALGRRGVAPSIPSNALTLGGLPLTLGGETLTLGA